MSLYVRAVPPRPTTNRLTFTGSANKIRFMAKKSENAEEKRVSATEASRSFSSLLDQVEAGTRFLIQRRGQDVCMMAPAPVRGRLASECLRHLRARSAVLLDDKFSSDLLQVLAEECVEEKPSWDS